MQKKWMKFLLTAVLTLSVTALTGCGGTQKGSSSPQETTAAAEKETSQDESTDTKDTKDAENKGSATEGTGRQNGTVYPLTVTDGLGDEVTIEAEPERVISLSPANTEILFALDAGAMIKGRTDYCSYPAEAADVPSIGTYTSPNTELIISMEPDVIFASDYMDDSIRKQVEAAGAKVVVFSANSVESVLDAILQAGKILNLNENAQALVDSMNADLEDLQTDIADKKGTRSVFVDIGSYYSAGPGSLLADMLDKIGATNIAADPGEAYPQLSVESIIEKDPDVYISLYTTAEELKETSGLNDLDCIKNDKITYYEALSNEADMIQRPGPRVVEGMELLAEQIYEK